MEVQVAIITKAAQSTLPAPEYVDEVYIAAAIGLSRKTLQDWRYRGGGPPFIKLSAKKRGRVRYHLPTVMTWLNSQQHFNTSTY